MGIAGFEYGAIRLDGAKELAVVLEQLPEKMAEGVMRGALKAGAITILTEAQRIAPLGHYPLPRNRAGTRESIGTLVDSMKVVTRRAGGELLAGIIFAGRAWYWRLVEFGHQLISHGKKKNQRRFIMTIPPHPFMRIAFDTMRGRSLDTMMDYARQRISQLQVRAAKIAFGGSEER
jgi:HK97 gp10 family phage protein